MFKSYGNEGVSADFPPNTRWLYLSQFLQIFF